MIVYPFTLSKKVVKFVPNKWEYTAYWICDGFMEESVIMKTLKNKLKEIIGETGKPFDTEAIKQFAVKYQLSLSNEYEYFLQNYGNSCTEDDYYFIVKDQGLGKLCGNRYELVDFFGLRKGYNNLEKKIEFYSEYLPFNLFPIGEIPGGDLFCMDKHNGKVYVWVHDLERNNLFLVAKEFKELIEGFTYIEPKDDIDEKIVSVRINDDLDALFKSAAAEMNAQRGEKGDPFKQS